MRALLVVSLVSLASAARLRAPPTDDDISGKLEALGPVLEKLKGLDPKTFGVLNGMMQQAKGNNKGMSFLQYLKDDPVEVQQKLEALGPILDKLKGLDPKSFGALSGLMGSVKADEAAPKGPALVQLKDDPSPEQVQEKLQALGPILDKLKGLDPKAFSTMSGLMNTAEQQVEKK